MRQRIANELTIIIGVVILIFALIFSWFQSTGVVDFVPGPPEANPPEIPHAVFGYQFCINCHGLDAIVPFPLSHVGYSNSVCTGCHVPSGVDIPPTELTFRNGQTLTFEETITQISDQVLSNHGE